VKQPAGEMNATMSATPALVGAYMADVIQTCGAGRGPLVSLVLFGSASTGGYTAPISDVDLLIVLDDQADAAMRRRLRNQVAELESRYNLSKPHATSANALADALAAFADRLTANVRAFFVCTRADLLSGDPGRILDLSPAQARFVDRVAIPSIMASGRTVWGEPLIDRVPLPPIRRLDVAKAFFGLFNQALFSAAVYPLLPRATKHAMDALKRSIHNCYFCYHGHSASLAAEVAFFEERYGPQHALIRLLALRQEYKPSLGFVLSCLPTLARLHFRTARDVQFPRAARAPS
jgi:predicted nucleotidyltransferase